jgi:RHS repeat-associated protein
MGLGGEQLSELTATNGWTHTNVFAAGGLLATYAGADTFFDLTDWQGTKRGETSAGECLGNWTSLPYGNDLTQSGTCGDASEHHYTGKVRDSETGYASGNDDFGARYFASSEGRWLSPDWSAAAEAVPYASYGSPQTLNLYAFSGNNPISRSDPDGHSPYGAQMTCSGGPSTGYCGVETDPDNSGIYTAGGMNDAKSGGADPVLGQANRDYYAANSWIENWADDVLKEDHQQGSSGQSNSTPTSSEQKAESHQRELVIQRTKQELGDGAEKFNIDGDLGGCTVVGGNCEFRILNPQLQDALNHAMGSDAGNSGSHWGWHDHDSNFSTSLHHDHDSLHIDHFNVYEGFGLGLILHGIVDVGVGHAFYAHKAFSY